MPRKKPASKATSAPTLLPPPPPAKSPAGVSCELGYEPCRLKDYDAADVHFTTAMDAAEPDATEKAGKESLTASSSPPTCPPKSCCVCFEVPSGLHFSVFTTLSCDLAGCQEASSICAYCLDETLMSDHSLESDSASCPTCTRRIEWVDVPGIGRCGRDLSSNGTRVGGTYVSLFAPPNCDWSGLHVVVDGANVLRSSLESGMEGERDWSLLQRAVSSLLQKGIRPHVVLKDKDCAEMIGLGLQVQVKEAEDGFDPVLAELRSFVVVAMPKSAAPEGEEDDMVVAELSLHLHCPYITNDAFSWRVSAPKHIRQWLKCTKNFGFELQFSVFDDELGFILQPEYPVGAVRRMESFFALGSSKLPDHVISSSSSARGSGGVSEAASFSLCFKCLYNRDDATLPSFDNVFPATSTIRDLKRFVKDRLEQVVKKVYVAKAPTSPQPPHSKTQPPPAKKKVSSDAAKSATNSFETLFDGESDDEDENCSNGSASEENMGALLSSAPLGVVYLYGEGGLPLERDAVSLAEVFYGHLPREVITVFYIPIAKSATQHPVPSAAQRANTLQIGQTENFAASSYPIPLGFLPPQSKQGISALLSCLYVLKDASSDKREHLISALSRASASCLTTASPFSYSLKLLCCKSALNPAHKAVLMLGLSAAHLAVFCEDDYFDKSRLLEGAPVLFSWLLADSSSANFREGERSWKTRGWLQFKRLVVSDWGEPDTVVEPVVFNGRPDIGMFPNRLEAYKYAIAKDLPLVPGSFEENEDCRLVRRLLARACLVETQILFLSLSAPERVVINYHNRPKISDGTSLNVPRSNFVDTRSGKKSKKEAKMTIEETFSVYTPLEVSRRPASSLVPHGGMLNVFETHGDGDCGGVVGSKQQGPESAANISVWSPDLGRSTTMNTAEAAEAIADRKVEGKERETSLRDFVDTATVVVFDMSASMNDPAFPAPQEEVDAGNTTTLFIGWRNDPQLTPSTFPGLSVALGEMFKNTLRVGISAVDISLAQHKETKVPLCYAFVRFKTPEDTETVYQELHKRRSERLLFSGTLRFDRATACKRKERQVGAEEVRQSSSRLASAKIALKGFTDEIIERNLSQALGLVVVDDKVKISCQITEALKRFAKVTEITAGAPPASNRGGSTCTRLYAGIEKALEMLNAYRDCHKECNRCRILVITDGEDTSGDSPYETLSKVYSNKVYVDVIGIGNCPLGNLAALSKCSGGMTLPATSPSDLHRSFQADELIESGSRAASKRMIDERSFAALSKTKSAEHRSIFNDARARAKEAATSVESSRVDQVVAGGLFAFAGFEGSAQATLAAHAKINVMAALEAPASINSEKSLSCLETAFQTREYDFVEAGEENIARTKRLLRELKKCGAHPHSSLTVLVSENDIGVWHAILEGPEGDSAIPYEGGTWRIVIRFPPDYPERPPTVTFLTRILHVNVDVSGKVCHAVLSTDYLKSMDMSYVLQLLTLLLVAPNFDSPSNHPLAKLYLQEKYAEYDGRIRDSVSHFALESKEILIAQCEHGELAELRGRALDTKEKEEQQQQQQQLKQLQGKKATEKLQSPLKKVSAAKEGNSTIASQAKSGKRVVSDVGVGVAATVAGNNDKGVISSMPTASFGANKGTSLNVLKPAFDSTPPGASKPDFDLKLLQQRPQRNLLASEAPAQAPIPAPAPTSFSHQFSPLPSVSAPLPAPSASAPSLEPSSVSSLADPSGQQSSQTLSVPDGCGVYQEVSMLDLLSVLELQNNSKIVDAFEEQGFRDFESLLLLEWAFPAYWESTFRSIPLKYRLKIRGALQTPPSVAVWKKLERTSSLSEGCKISRNSSILELLSGLGLQQFSGLFEEEAFETVQEVLDLLEKPENVGCWETSFGKIPLKHRLTLRKTLKEVAARS